MSRYYANYGQYLGAQRCCDLRGQGPVGPQGPTGASAIGQRGFTGPPGESITGPTGKGCRGPTGPSGGPIGPTGPTGPAGKSFIIEHPLDSDKYLVHTCLEGPEAGVYYRGMGRINNNVDVEIELPHYVSALAHDFTVNLTPVYDGKQHLLSTSLVENNRFKVYGDNCDFFWTVFGKRFDVTVEPDKNSVDVKGDGPYLYI
jgi:hypothetical protein